MNTGFKKNISEEGSSETDYKLSQKEEKPDNSIYSYLDYREFMKDRVAISKAAGKPFSNRNFTKKSGLKSSGHLSLIIQGKRNLGRSALYKVCRGFNLNEKEARFFTNLVNFNQSKNVEEQNHFYKQLLKQRPVTHSRSIDARHYELFSKWYYIAILELVRTHDFKSDPKWIAKKLKPNVTAAKVSRAIEELKELNLIRVTDGRLARAHKMISTPEAVKSLGIINFQEQLSKLGIEALKTDSVNDKEFATLTIAVSRKDFPEVKRRIQEFKKELHSFLEVSENKREDVIHINLQLFKLTKRSEQ